jgi:hypothetical protein
MLGDSYPIQVSKERDGWMDGWIEHKILKSKELNATFAMQHHFMPRAIAGRLGHHPPTKKRESYQYSRASRLINYTGYYFLAFF